MFFSVFLGFVPSCYEFSPSACEGFYILVIERLIDVRFDHGFDVVF